MKSRMREVYLDQNMTIPTLKVTEGILNLQDHLSKSLLNHINPNMHLLTGITRFPTPPRIISNSSISDKLLSDNVGGIKSLFNSLLNPKDPPKP